MRTQLKIFCTFASRRMRVVAQLHSLGHLANLHSCQPQYYHLGLSSCFYNITFPIDFNLHSFFSRAPCQDLLSFLMIKEVVGTHSSKYSQRASILMKHVQVKILALHVYDPYLVTCTHRAVLN
jgi:hypothetical protein